MEKGGCRVKLEELGCKDPAGTFWSDEMRMGLIGQVRRVWAPRGVKVVQAVEFKHDWAYLNLAVNGLTGRLHWDWAENMKGVSIAPIVKGWEEKGVSAIVWDGARGHHGPAYEGIELSLIQQPPYSPELNPAERVFEYLRDRVEGHVYGTLTAKKRAIERELDTLAAQPETVRSLAGWDWIRQALRDVAPTNTAFQ